MFHTHVVHRYADAEIIDPEGEWMMGMLGHTDISTNHRGMLLQLLVQCTGARPNLPNDESHMHVNSLLLVVQLLASTTLLQQPYFFYYAYKCSMHT